MSKRSPLDEKLSAITRARRETLTPESLSTLRTGLADKHGVIVEQAALAAKELSADALAEDLRQTFERCLRGEVNDRPLLATTAVADALQSLRAGDVAAYLRGMRLFRPTLPSGDAAAGVRAACAFGLARSRYRHDVWELATLLHDPIAGCRTAAARAMAMTGVEAALPLLKFKVLSGDRESEVVGECFSAMMSLSPDLALTFVAAQLDSTDDVVVESAALALGESRHAAALPELSQRVGIAVGPTRRALLLAVGLLRSEPALAYLLDRVTHADDRTAVDAVIALGLYKQDPTVKTRLTAAVTANGAKAVRDAFAQEFR